MGAAFSLNRTRVTVTRETLEKIADILNVSKIERDRIVTEGVGGTAPSPSSQPTRSARGGRGQRSPAAGTQSPARSGRAQRSPRSGGTGAAARNMRRPRQE